MKSRKTSHDSKSYASQPPQQHRKQAAARAYCIECKKPLQKEPTRQERLEAVARQRERRLMAAKNINKIIEQFDTSFSSPERTMLLKTVDAYLITRVPYMEQSGMSDQGKLQFVGEISNCFLYATVMAKVVIARVKELDSVKRS